MTDTTTLRLKPAEDRRVRHPDGRVMDADGETVARSPYWLRRLADGDVVAAGPTAKTKD